jgi:chromosome segregation ATPase
LLPTAAKLKFEISQARNACAAMEAERKKWLSQLEQENSQLKQLYDDAKRAKEQLIVVRHRFSFGLGCVSRSRDFRKLTGIRE